MAIDCDPSALVQASNAYTALSRKQLLGALVYVQCIGGGGTTTNPLTTAWIDNVANNGGPPPTDTTTTSINTFLNALDSCGVLSKILDLCVFVPDSLIAATTPLIAGTANPWTNHNFVSGDLGINGLTGNGSSKFLEAGLVPNLAGPQFTTTSACLFFYAYTANTTALGTEIGANDTATDSAFVSNFNFGGIGTLSDLHGSGPRITVASPGNGFYLASRIANNDNKIYFANSGTAWSAIANNALGSSALPTAGYVIYGFNTNGVVSQFSNSTLSCVGIAAGLTSAEGQCLYNAVQALRMALGGGFR